MSEREESVREEAALSKELLTQWHAQEPPPAFEHRVLARLRREGLIPSESSGQNSTKRSSARSWVYAAVAVLALGFGVWKVGYVDFSSKVDEFAVKAAASRQSLSIADRALVVIEANTKMSWRKSSDGLLVRQENGSVFYRVDKGEEPFVVKTTFGDVEVTGTCFSISFGNVPADLIVSVFEGSVKWTRGGERGLLLDAGESGRLVAGKISKLDNSKLTPDGTGIQKTGMSPPRQKNRTIQNPSVDSSHDETEETQQMAQRCAFRVDENCPDYVSPSDEILRLRAECGSISWDPAPLLFTHADAVSNPLSELGKLVSLSAKERTGIRRAEEKYESEVRSELFDIYLELQGDMNVAKSLSTSELMVVVRNAAGDELSDGENGEELVNRVIEAAASEMLKSRSVAPSKSDAANMEKVMRLDFRSGQRFEELLAEEVGLARAHEIRSARDGWMPPQFANTRSCAEKLAELP